MTLKELSSDSAVHRSLVGDRIVLRDWQLKDLESLAYWLQDHHKWNETDGPYYPRYTPEDIITRCEGIKTRILKNDFPRVRKDLPIIEKGTERLVGSVVWYWQSEETLWLSIGITLFDEADWGQGMGFEAIVLWCQYLLEVFPELERLDLRTWSGNPGMMALAEKIGFRKEAVFRKARIVKGVHYDGIGYGMLRSEFEERYGFEGPKKGIRYYNKIVRDLIPEIIMQTNKVAVCEHVTSEVAIHGLIDKIEEETKEFAEAFHQEELADLLEIIHGIAYHLGLSMADLEDVRLKKCLKNGGFEKALVLKSVQSNL